jgi:tRNA-dihydrouridine synthase 3
MRRHADEDLFGVQLTSSQPLPFVQCCEIIQQNLQVDFVDINLGCPIDVICKKGAGSALMEKRSKLRAMILGARSVLDCPITVKLRTGITEQKIAHSLIPKLQEWGAAAVTLHGRSKKQRYTKTADWDYIAQCADLVDPNKMAFFGNGDIFNPEDYIERMNASANISGLMIGRGALVKPWIFKEFKEQKLWDISANERFDILKQFSNYGLTHWGSDTQGVNMTRRYMCEWMSFLYRYVPVGIIETLPQRLNLRPERFVGRNDLETLMSSGQVQDWIKLSEMILGPAPESFKFVPKHKSNSYEQSPVEG